jgi:spore germination protein (amino acid permease)
VIGGRRMIDTKLQISSKQLFVFLLSTQCGLEILRLPSRLVRYAGHDGWISILLTIIPSSISIVLIIHLAKRYKGKSLYNINKLLFGKLIGTVFNIVFMMYCLISSSLILRIFAEVARMTGLKKTPSIFIASIALVPSIILLKNGLQAVCRFSNAIVPVIGITLIYCYVNISKIDLLNLLPVGSSGFNGIFNGMIISSSVCLGVELIPVVYLHVSDKGKVMSSALMANLVNILFVLIIVFMTTTIFGENMLKHLVIPLFSLFRIYSSDIIERTDAFFIIIWFPALMCVFRAYFYSAFHGINEQYKISHKRILLTVLLILTLVLSRVPKSFNDVYKYLYILDRFGGSVVLFLIICYLLSFINKKGVNKEGASL